jgi:hypothetical protein
MLFDISPAAIKRNGTARADGLAMSSFTHFDLKE